jgi:hypothetical protein
MGAGHLAGALQGQLECREPDPRPLKRGFREGRLEHDALRP